MVVRPIDGIGHIDHFGIDAGAHRFEHSFAGALGREVDGAGAIEIERDAGLVRRDQREDHLAHISPRQVMRFQWIAGNFDSGFYCSDSIVDNHSNGDAT